jgi:hypothetical protein
MLKLNVLTGIALVLAIIGALNWGLIGFFGFNLVSSIFGVMTPLTRIIYGLVGIGAVVLIVELCMTVQHRHHTPHPAHPM